MTRRRRQIASRIPVLAIAAGALFGCAGSSIHAATSPSRGRASVDHVRFSWRRLPDGEVCYRAIRVGHDHPGGNGVLSACVRHLRADEIAFVLRPRGTGQQMIAGLKGPRVKGVYLRLAPTRRWTPPSNGNVFFGYVPAGRVVSVVKLLEDGRKTAFPVNVVSK